MHGKLKYLFTGLIVLIAVLVVALKYWDYVTNPWTRDGQVRAQVIQITPRVSGPLVKLPVKDNQFVKAGDLLFQIDPRTFEADLEHARATLDNTRDEIEALAKQVEAAQADVEAAGATVKQAQAAIKGYSGRVVESKKEYKRQKTLDKQEATSKRAVETARANWVSYVNQKANADAQLMQMQASLSEANANLAKARADLGAPGEQNAQVRQAKAEVRSAELNLEFTQKKAPVDGYVTNLNLRLGSQAVENQPIMALVDVNSYWITGFFRENYIRISCSRAGWTPWDGALPRMTAAPALICCRISARLSSGFVWPSVCPCAFTLTLIICHRESNCGWAPPHRFWS